jgi:5-methylthioribose kinase
MHGTGSFQALTVDTLPVRLGQLPLMRERVGTESARWDVREVGDGNLNLVFIVAGERGSVVVKQALPYFRLVGESWPLSLRRNFFEYEAYLRQEARAPGTTPVLYHVDERQAFIVMEHLAGYLTLRKALIRGDETPQIAEDLGLFMARTLFRGSDLEMDASERKADLALFAGNADLCAITEGLVFSDPYFAAPYNRHTAPQLDRLVASLRADTALRVRTQELKHIFVTKAETLIHGDLHTGSVMVAAGSTKVIDPEFAFYGPMAFDVGVLLGDLWMSYFSQRGHEHAGSRDALRRYLLRTVAATWTCFREEFLRLWHEERQGMLYPRSVFEENGDALGAERAFDAFMQTIWQETLGFAGIGIHRRIMGLAHNADFELIADPDLRARCEAQALYFGRHLIMDRESIQSVDEANALAAALDRK